MCVIKPTSLCSVLSPYVMCLHIIWVSWPQSPYTYSEFTILHQEQEPGSITARRRWGAARAIRQSQWVTSFPNRWILMTYLNHVMSSTTWILILTANNRNDGQKQNGGNPFPLPPLLKHTPANSLCYKETEQAKSIYEEQELSTQNCQSWT